MDTATSCHNEVISALSYTAVLLVTTVRVVHQERVAMPRRRRLAVLLKIQK